MSDDLLFPRPDSEEMTEPSNLFVDYLNELTGGLWGIGLPMMVFALVYFSLNDFDPEKSFAAASFSTLVVTVILIGLGAITSEALIIMVLLVSLAVVLNNGGDRI